MATLEIYLKTEEPIETATMKVAKIYPKSNSLGAKASFIAGVHWTIKVYITPAKRDWVKPRQRMFKSGNMDHFILKTL